MLYKFKNIKSTILNVSIFVVLLIIVMLLCYKEVDIHSKMLVNSSGNEILIKNENGKFTDSDIEDFFIDCSLDINRISFNKNIQVSTAKIDFVGYVSSSLKFPYFNEPSNNDYIFKVFNPKQSLNIIGEFPQDSNEVLINKILADNIIERGVYVIKDDEVIPYKFFSYDELIGSKVRIHFGNIYLVVTGIIDDDFSKFEVLKNSDLDSKELNKLYDEFVYYNNKQNTFIVSEEFFSNLKFNEFLEADFTNYTGKPDYYYYGINIDRINAYQNLVIYNSDFVNEMALQDNEIVIDLFTLDMLTEHDFTKEYILWKNKNVDSFDDFKLFLKEYVDNNNIVGNSLDLIIKDVDSFENKSNEMLIAGIRLDGYSYLENLKDNSDIASLSKPIMLLNSSVVNNYSQYSYKPLTSFLSLNISSKSELKELFNKLEDNNKYEYETRYKSLVKDITSWINAIKLILWFVLLLLVSIKVYIIIRSKKVIE